MDNKEITASLRQVLEVIDKGVVVSGVRNITSMNQCVTIIGALIQKLDAEQKA